MNFLRIMSVIGLCCCIGFSCASTDVGVSPEEEMTDEQTEEDILRLLGLEDDTDTSTSDIYAPQDDRNAQMVDQIEKYQMEINELKSELILKDERISRLERELESARGTRPAQSVTPYTPDVSTPPPSAAIGSGNFSQRYDVFLKMVRYQGKYREAISGFRALLEENMYHSLSDNCQYWIGEAYFALKDYRQAIVEFEKVFTFSNSNKDDHAQLKIAICYYKLGQMDQAKAEFNRMIMNYPDSDVYYTAQQYLNRIP